MTATRNDPRWGAIGSLILLAGCAGLPFKPPISSVPPTATLSILDVPPSVDDGSLRRLFHASKKNPTPNELSADRLLIEQRVDIALKQALANADLPPLNTANVMHTDDMALAKIGQPVDSVNLAVLQDQHPADAYLRVELIDYGQTPKSWKSAYVIFEITTTLAIAGALYVHTVSRPLAGAYLVEEGVEEFGEGYAGFWLINRLSRPVRIEADLVDGKTGAVLWHDSETGMADWHWKHLWHMDAATRDTLLTISTDKAVDDLVNELSGK